MFFGRQCKIRERISSLLAGLHAHYGQVISTAFAENDIGKHGSKIATYTDCKHRNTRVHTQSRQQDTERKISFEAAVPPADHLLCFNYHKNLFGSCSLRA